MKTEQIVTLIENWILRGLNHRYSAHVPFARFTNEFTTQEISGLLNQFSVIPQINPSDCQIKCQYYRFPQTRIYYQEFKTEQFYARSIEYQNESILVLYPIRISDNYKFELIKPQATQFIYTPDIKFRDKSTFVFKQFEPVVFVFFPEHEQREWNNLNAMLESFLNKEYVAHPLQQLHSNDKPRLQKIDEAWAALNFIDGKRDIQINPMEPQLNSLFMWLQESYLHFGWHAELDVFYARHPEFVKSETGKLIKLRFDSVLRAQKTTIPEVQDNDDFVRQYFSGKIDEKTVQDYWEHIHYPALRLRLASEIRVQPDKFISFGLIAIQHNFSWQDKYISLLLEFLPKRFRPIVSLLIELKKSTPWFSSGYVVDFLPAANESLLTKLVQQKQKNSFSHVQHNKKHFTKVQFEGQLEFQIDKKTKLSFQKNKKYLAIQPLIYYPPLQKLEFFKINICFAGYTLIVPLTWSQFEIKCNNLRIKFLRKSGRFQLTIKNKSGQELSIDGQKVTGPQTNSFKYYIPINKRESSISAGLFNEWGTVASQNQTTFIQGSVLDVFGIYHNSVQCGQVGSKKTEYVELNSQKNLKPQRPEGAESLVLFCRNCKPTRIEPLKEADYLTHLLYTDAETLAHKLVVYTDEDKGKILRVFFEELGFYPVIQGLAAIRTSNSIYPLIVSEKYEKNKVSPENGFTPIMLLNSRTNNALMIHPNVFREALCMIFAIK